MNSDLLGRNREGQPESVRYEQINAMLLNEFLKEHRKVEEQGRRIQEQETTIAELKSEMRSMAVIVNEQASELQKVSTRIEMTQSPLHRAQSSGRATDLRYKWIVGFLLSTDTQDFSDIR